MSENSSEESIKDINESVETSNEIFSDTDTPDWNELLDSYEQYVDKYISYVKKAAKGDMDALAEYPSLMQKAQELSEKMEGAQSNMSESQWARYMKITNKMTKALQELQ
jgi:preprotein translocase subunit Sss1